MSNWHVQGHRETEAELRKRVKPRIEIEAGTPFITPVEVETRIPTGKRFFSFHDIPSENWDRIFGRN